jgi:hypothetical protein
VKRRDRANTAQSDDRETAEAALTEEELETLLPLAYLIRDPRDESAAGDGDGDWWSRWGGQRATRRRNRLLITGAVLLLTVLWAVAVPVIAFQAGSFTPEEMQLLLPPSATGNRARGVVLWDDRRMLLYADGLPDPAPGYRVVVWAEQSGQTELVARVRVRNGATSLRTSRRGRSDFRLTVEPAGAVSAPSGPVLLQTVE